MLVTLTSVGTKTHLLGICSRSTVITNKRCGITSQTPTLVTKPSLNNQRRYFSSEIPIKENHKTTFFPWKLLIGASLISAVGAHYYFKDDDKKLDEQMQLDMTRNSINLSVSLFVSSFRFEMPIKAKFKIPVLPNDLSLEIDNGILKCQIVNGKIEGYLIIYYHKEHYKLKFENGVPVEIYMEDTNLDTSRIKGTFTDRKFSGTYFREKSDSCINSYYENGVLIYYKEDVGDFRIKEIKKVQDRFVGKECYYKKFYSSGDEGITFDDAMEAANNYNGKLKAQFTLNKDGEYTGLREEFDPDGTKTLSLNYSSDGKIISGFVNKNGFLKKTVYYENGFIKRVVLPRSDLTYTPDDKIESGFIKHHDGATTFYENGRMVRKTGPKVDIVYAENNVPFSGYEKCNKYDVYYENGIAHQVGPDIDMYIDPQGMIISGYEKCGGCSIYYENGIAHQIGPKIDMYFDPKGMMNSGWIKTVRMNGQIFYKDGKIDYEQSWQNDSDGRSLKLDEGEIIVWKACKPIESFYSRLVSRCYGTHDDYVYVKLRVPAEAKRIRLIPESDKTRVEYAIVEEIIGVQTGRNYSEAISCVHSDKITYNVGETVYPDEYDDNARNECSKGINVHKYQELCAQWFRFPC